MISRTAFVVGGLVLALVIGTAAVFFASADPDGLDSTALITQGQKELTSPANPDAEIDESILPGSFEYEAPFPDYTVEGASALTNVILMVVGIVLAVLVVAGLGYGLKRMGGSGTP
jgi:cobalt/nickel transport protein